jgi:large subunit ribosomal protein L18
MLKKQEKRVRRHKRVRAKIIGSLKVPRFCVFRSNKHIYGQLINDDKRKTLVSISDKGIKIKSASKKTTEGEIKLSGKIAVAFEVGKLIAEKAIELKIDKVIFDRGGYKYHGRVKALADGAREGGLKF